MVFLRFWKIVLHNKITNKTQTTKNQENSAHRCEVKGNSSDKNLPKVTLQYLNKAIAAIFYFGQVFAFSNLINKNVLKWFLPIICKEQHGVKVGPGPHEPWPPSKFKSGTPGHASKFKSGALNSISSLHDLFCSRQIYIYIYRDR